MRRTAKVRSNSKLPTEKSILDMLPLTCRHLADHSEIEGYLPASDDWATIIELRYREGVRAKALVDFLVRAANDWQKDQDLISQLAAALDICLGCNGKLTWEAEQEAQVVLSRAQRKQ